MHIPALSWTCLHLVVPRYLTSYLIKKNFMTIFGCFCQRSLVTSMQRDLVPLRSIVLSLSMCALLHVRTTVHSCTVLDISLFRCPSISFSPYSVQLCNATHRHQHPRFCHVQLLLLCFPNCSCLSPVHH